MTARLPGVLTSHFEPEREPLGTAVVLPGRGYPPVAPLLAFAGHALVQHGWAVEQVWWNAPGDHGDTDYYEWVAEQLLRHLPESGPVLVVGKSLGTLAAPLAAERGYDAIWLTPLLQEQRVVDAIAANPGRQLLVGGTADEHEWRSAVASRLAEQGCRVLEVPDADHGMLVPGDVVRGAQIQLEIVRAIDAFLGG